MENKNNLLYKDYMFDTRIFHRQMEDLDWKLKMELEKFDPDYEDKYIQAYNEFYDIVDDTFYYDTWEENVFPDDEEDNSNLDEDKKKYLREEFIRYIVESVFEHYRENEPDIKLFVTRKDARKIASDVFDNYMN